MPNAFEKELGIPLPQCCNKGDCCKGASPSTPFYKLWEKAQAGDDFARGFLSIMIPYETHAEAEKVVPGLVARTLKAAEKSGEFSGPEDLKIYRCRYVTADNKCGVWEDRPQFCRDYPDTPFVVMAPGCAFEPWAAACKDKYNAMKAEVARLKELKEELARLRAIQGGEAVEPDPKNDSSGDPVSDRQETGHPYTKIDDLVCAGNNTDNLSLVLSLTRLYVASPLRSVYLVF